MWPFKKRDYLEGSVLVSSETAWKALNSYSTKFRDVSLSDNKYRVLTEQNMRKFAFKYSTEVIEYGGNHKSGGSNDSSFPDCDDFAAILRGCWLKGCIAEAFDYSIIAGELWYKKPSGSRHALNWTLWIAGDVIVPVLYEPQNDSFEKNVDEEVVSYREMWG